MDNREHSRPEVIKITRLISDYINCKDNSVAKIALRDMKEIKGDDFVDALDNLGLISREKYNELKNENSDLNVHCEEKNKEITQMTLDYTELNEKYTFLIDGLESIIKDSLQGKIINLLRESKQK
jgi:hypothetical protein